MSDELTRMIVAEVRRSLREATSRTHLRLRRLKSRDDLDKYVAIQSERIPGYDRQTWRNRERELDLILALNQHAFEQISEIGVELRIAWVRARNANYTDKRILELDPRLASYEIPVNEKQVREKDRAQNRRLMMGKYADLPYGNTAEIEDTLTIILDNIVGKPSDKDKDRVMFLIDQYMIMGASYNDIVKFDRRLKKFIRPGYTPTYDIWM